VSGWLGLVLLIGLLTVAILLVVALAVRHGQDRAAEAARWRERSEQDQWNWDLLRGVSGNQPALPALPSAPHEQPTGSSETTSPHRQHNQPGQAVEAARQPEGIKPERIDRFTWNPGDITIIFDPQNPNGAPYTPSDSRPDHPKGDSETTSP